LRELKNLLERAYILSSNQEIGLNDLPLGQKDTTADGHGNALTGQLSIPLTDTFDLTGVLEEAEKDLIIRTLNASHGGQAEAARRMGLSRSALAYKLTKYEIRSQ
jgi:DNA-binding NtrC family response regulator